MWKPMLPKLSESVPSSGGWAFEVKYDGFRALLKWTESTIELISRNGKDLSPHFPEILDFCRLWQEPVKSYLPLELDGEIVILNTPLQANFSLLQQRGRMKNKIKILEMAQRRSASFLAFDALMLNGENRRTASYESRKKALHIFFQDMKWDGPIHSGKRIGFVPSSDDFTELWNEVFAHFGEGIVAKQKKRTYEEGKRVDHWLKMKNWRNVKGIVTGYNTKNQYYQLSVYHGDELKALGSVKHGFSDEEFHTLRSIFLNQGNKSGETLLVPPAICAQIHCLNAVQGELREPMFDQFRLDLETDSCTVEQVKQDLLMFPEEVEITHPNKVLWPRLNITKIDYLMYLRQICPYILPFFRQKPLTLIRYPHGIHDTSFYQKHRADYTPDFIDSFSENGEKLILCQNVSALIWLGNQGTIEFHIPFNRKGIPIPTRSSLIWTLHHETSFL